jgi:hypothetical protein
MSNILNLTKEFEKLNNDFIILEGLFSNIAKGFDKTLFGAQKFLKGADQATVDRINAKVDNILKADTNKLKTAFDIINRATTQRNQKLKNVVTQLKSEISNSKKIDPNQKSSFIKYLDARLKASNDIIEPLQKIKNAILDPIDPLNVNDQTDQGTQGTQGAPVVQGNDNQQTITQPPPDVPQQKLQTPKQNNKPKKSGKTQKPLKQKNKPKDALETGFDQTNQRELDKDNPEFEESYQVK